MGDARSSGSATRRDIDSQADVWEEAVRVAGARAGEIATALQAVQQALFVGCGSSYNVAMLAAAGWNALARVPSRALSAGEFLRFRETASTRPEREAVCFLSRSGTTSETLAALRAAKAAGSATFALCCTADSPLAREADRVVALPGALEEAIIATRSVTAMGLAALLLAALAGGAQGTAEDLRRLPALARAASDPAFQRGEALLPAGVERVVFLGSGPLWATALGAQLVCQELALMEAWAYPVLEFRHGPIVLARPGTLLVLFASRTAGDLEAALFDDLTRRGCRRLWVGPPFPSAEPEELLAIPAGLSDWARAVAALPSFHAAAWGRTLREGRDPDDGSGLPRVVELPL